MCPFMSVCNLSVWSLDRPDKSNIFTDFEQQTCCSSVRCWSEVNCKFGEPLVAWRDRAWGANAERILSCSFSHYSRQWDESEDEEDQLEEYRSETESKEDSGRILRISQEKISKLQDSEDLLKKVHVEKVLQKSQASVQQEIMKSFASIFL